MDEIAGEIKEYRKVVAIEAIQDNTKTNGTQMLHEREVEGEMALLEMELEAGNMLTFYDGEMVKSLQGDNFYSFYGYSNKIDNYALVDNEKVNLNLVITYDEEKDVTHVIWATPFLNEDF